MGAEYFSREFTIFLSPQCKAFTRALQTEKLKAPLFPGLIEVLVYIPVYYTFNRTQLLCKTLNQYHAICMRFFSKMQLVSNCYMYTANLYKPISKLYVYKSSAVHLYDCRVTYFCKIQELKNPTIIHLTTTNMFVPHRIPLPQQRNIMVKHI